jgi:hypothetical protein
VCQSLGKSRPQLLCVRVYVCECEYLYKVVNRQGLARGRTISVDCDYCFACALISAPPLPSPVTERIHWVPFTATAVQHLHISWSEWRKQCRSEAEPNQ